MPQYTVTATFDNVDEALRFLTHGDGNRAAIGTAAPAPAAKAVKTKAAAEAPAPAAAASAPAPAASAPAASAPKGDAAVDYPTLQKAVFKLAGIATGGRAAATELLAQFKVSTFKELPADKWVEALAAVEAKIEELSVPA